MSITLHEKIQQRQKESEDTYTLFSLILEFASDNFEQLINDDERTLRGGFAGALLGNDAERHMQALAREHTLESLVKKAYDLRVAQERADKMGTRGPIDDKAALQKEFSDLLKESQVKQKKHQGLFETKLNDEYLMLARAQDKLNALPSIEHGGYLTDMIDGGGKTIPIPVPKKRDTMLKEVENRFDKLYLQREKQIKEKDDNRTDVQTIHREREDNLHSLKILEEKLKSKRRRTPSEFSALDKMQLIIIQLSIANFNQLLASSQKLKGRTSQERHMHAVLREEALNDLMEQVTAIKSSTEEHAKTEEAIGNLKKNLDDFLTEHQKFEQQDKGFFSKVFNRTSDVDEMLKNAKIGLQDIAIQQISIVQAGSKEATVNKTEPRSAIHQVVATKKEKLLNEEPPKISVKTEHSRSSGARP